MLTFNELSQKVSDYSHGLMSLEQFENWFEDNSNGAYADPKLSKVYAAVVGRSRNTTSIRSEKMP